MKEIISKKTTPRNKKNKKNKFKKYALKRI